MKKYRKSKITLKFIAFRLENFSLKQKHDYEKLIENSDNFLFDITGNKIFSFEKIPSFTEIALNTKNSLSKHLERSTEKMYTVIGVISNVIKRILSKLDLI